MKVFRKRKFIKFILKKQLKLLAIGKKLAIGINFGLSAGFANVF